MDVIESWQSDVQVEEVCNQLSDLLEFTSCRDSWFKKLMDLVDNILIDLAVAKPSPKNLYYDEIMEVTDVIFLFTNISYQ